MNFASVCVCPNAMAGQTIHTGKVKLCVVSWIASEGVP